MRRRWKKTRRKKVKGVLPKGPAVIDEALLATYRGPGRCWWCGWWSDALEAAHIFARGQESWSRFDIPENLASLCRQCHQASHDGQRPLTFDLLTVVATKLRTTEDAIRDKIDTLKWGRT